MTARPKENPLLTLDAMDEIFLDVATIIELSPDDRRVADNRFRRLKQHIEREKSPLVPFINNDEYLVYAQGSIATNTTIVSGTDDDRFDVDAIVEFRAPENWDPSYPLDLLEETLQGFPGAEKIERCTRCVQIQFPSMHMDVTLLDRSAEISIARAGEIFHSPDEGDAYRVASAPWGFTDWYRSRVGREQGAFTEALAARRLVSGRSRLRALDDQELRDLRAADQVPLPPMIPTRMDAQESVALKLLKRNLNIAYERKSLKRPPSIFFAKRTGDYGFRPEGLTVQLHGLATFIASDLRRHLAQDTRPNDVNPAYPADQITDRWPRVGAEGIADMTVLAETLENLAEKIEHAAEAPMDKIAEIVDELFGERVGAEQRRILKERYARQPTSSSLLIKPGSGQVYAPAIVRSREDLQPIPRHNFHCGLLKKPE